MSQADSSGDVVLDMEKSILTDVSPKRGIMAQNCDSTRKARMSTVTIEEAQAKLPELIAQLPVGEELIITKGERQIARLSAEPRAERKPRKAGSAKGILKIVVEDDEHLKDFEEYMP
jgi:antitoxin (DNA-binding transcriptional repressor) of toxin-antitoxin stability system